MKNRRLGIALVVALAISLVVTYSLYSRLKKHYSKASSIHVVATSTALEAGTQIVENQMVMVAWPAELPTAGTFSSPEKLVGRILLYALPAQDPIRESMLAPPGSAVGLTAKIPEGMRAVAVVTDEVNNLSGFLFPGSRVDVLVTFRPDLYEGLKEALTTTILQSVEILSTGEKLQPDPSGKPQNVKVVTLLLNPEDAERLMLASNQGKIQFVMRNAADQAQVETRPVQIGEFRGAATPSAVNGKGAKAPVASRSNSYRVEVFDGAKKSVVNF